MTDDAVKQFVSSKGARLTLRPVSQFKLDTLRASKKELSPPTYETKVAGGDTINLPMDEEIARNKNRLPEWEAHVKEKNRLDAEYSKKFFELLVWDGVEVEIPPKDSDWQRVCERFGLTVPDDPIDRKIFYVYNEVLSKPEDLGELISEILETSQLDEDAVNKLRSSFRLAILRKADKQLSKKQKRMEGKSDI